MRHFIGSCHFVTHNHGTDSFDVFLCSQWQGAPYRSLSVTLVRPFLSVATYLYTPRCGKALHPYCAESLQWISAPGIASAHNICITARCFLAHTESGTSVSALLWDTTTSRWMSKSISQSHTEFVLLSARKIISVANTRSLKIKHCENFLTQIYCLCVVRLCNHCHISYDGAP
jgi:hypothetical protein